MTWHHPDLTDTQATILLIVLGLFVTFAISEGVRRSNYAKGVTSLKEPAMWFVGTLLAVIWFLLLLFSTVKLIETLLVDDPGELRWISLLFLGLTGAPFVIWRSVVAQAQSDTASQGMITDRINKAVEGLGAEKTVKRPVRGADGTTTYEEATEPNLEVRVGAVLSLERIAKNSPDDHIQIMEILCAYIRENACIVNIGTDGDPNWQQRVDTQTAITVIGRRAPSAIAGEEARGPAYRLDLRHSNLQCTDMSQGRFGSALFQGTLLGKSNLARANLREAKLWDANLKGAQLGGANLQEAELSYAKLQGAELEYANLQEAQLGLAKLQGAGLWGANLQGAELRSANLQGAELEDANLQGAGLWGANLQEAQFRGANLQGAWLGYANLQGAELSEANLQGAELGYANLQGAYLVGANLVSTDLRRCRMDHTRLRSVDFTEDTKIDAESLTAAFGVKSGIGLCKLDGDYPAHWHVAADVDEDGPEHQYAYNIAYDAWVAKNPLPKE